jgi:GntP family gluconate:H+ symporter
MLSVTGEKNSPWALGITGFITGLPIFCDSGFIVLSGLTKSFSARSGMALPFMATVLATSLYSVHCLIPPHPGALAAAGIIDANIGNLIIAGILFAIPGALAAGAWAGFMVKGKNYPASVYSEGDFRRDKKDLPPVFLSFLPVVLPLLLITTRSLINLFDTEGAGLAARIFRFPGEPVFALAAGALSGLLLMRDRKISSLNEVFSEAIVKAGPILIVTAAGGMFGMIIAQTGAGESMGKLLADTNAGLLVPFLIALILKTAQGSSTVAIITAASLVLPMMNMLGLDSEWGRLLAMLSMGAGSMIVSHANDSYFWVVTNFSGIDIKAALRVYSTSTIVMGVVIFVLIWISSFILI